MSSSDTNLPPQRRPGPRWYNAVWRWHFYAGLCCIPFVIWLSLTGSLYLWRPQIEAWIDRAYDHLPTSGPIVSEDMQVAAALRAVPGGTLHRYIVPEQPDQATRILVGIHGEDMRVMVDPRSLAVLSVEPEEQRFFRLIFHLHGELLAGAVGSTIVEIAACWAVVMLLTGLFLWWPRGQTRLAGVLYPRLNAGPRLFWRDIHATTGLWVSLFALILILTGLPWAQGWGSYLAEVRALTGSTRGPVDWTVGGKPPNQDPIVGEHTGHAGKAMPPPPPRAGELGRVVRALAPLQIAPPVVISPPKHAGAPWSVKSTAADRPLRSDLEVDGATGRIIKRVDFAQRHWIDQVIGTGVAVHEGALFGLANQILGTLTALFLVVLAVSGVVLWVRRRPTGVLGAPIARPRPQIGIALVGTIIMLGLYLPLFGITLILVLLVETLLLRRIPRTRNWLGLGASAHA